MTDPIDPPETMETVPRRALGGTGIEIPEATLGTWGLMSGAYGPTPEPIVEDTLAAALESGVASFDMAPLWGGEALVAAAVGDKRDEVIYTTRVGASFRDGTLSHRFTASSLREDLERSLSRLKTDHVDVCLAHSPPEYVLRSGAWSEALAGFKEDGLTRAWGASVENADQARLAIKAGAEVLALRYNLLDSDLVHDLSGELVDANVGVMARSPLLHGLLAGSWMQGHAFDPGDHRADRWSSEALTKRLAHVNRLRFLVRGDLYTLFGAAIRFVLASKLISTAVLGARSRFQVEDVTDHTGLSPYLSDDDLIRVSQELANMGL